MQRVVEEVHVAPALQRYMVAIVNATRSHPAVELGASPRGSLALLALGRAWALLRGRDFVLPEDVKDVAAPALAHRLTLTPEQWVRGTKSEEIVSACIEMVAVPSPEEVARPG
jgi:MoxR-like ATPase